MAPDKDAAATYAASCNPARRAKRARADDDRQQGPSSAPSAATAAVPVQQQQQPQLQQQQQRLRPQQLLPRDAQPARVDPSPYHDSSDDEDEYDPVLAAPTPKRRGRKPGPMSRSARESQRKLNHSRIEKARRTKINETLSTLSNLVSEAEKEKRLIDPSRAPPEETGSKGDKEFKLDVLLKTVTYLQELIEKVKVLETRSCSNCADGSVTAVAGEKRKRPIADQDEDMEIIEVASSSHASSPAPSTASNAPATRPISSRAASRQPGPSPCLPPISAWLPHPFIDPSCLTDGNLPPSVSQLPTPPLSGTFRTPLSLSSQVLPALSLPGPAHPLHSQPSSPSSARPFARSGARVPVPASVRRQSNASSGTGTSAGRSPPVSPSWTPEDETAASLLLQMSSSPASSVSGSSMPATTPKMRVKSLEVPQHQRQQQKRVTVDRRMSQSYPVHAETPSSLLGLDKAA